MRTQVRAAVVTILMLGSVLLAPAVADERTVHDPDDSSSAVDVSSVKQGHYGGYALYLVKAFDPWEPQDLENGRMVFRFNLDDDRAIERRGILEYDGTSGTGLRATVVDRDGERIGRGVYRRPSGDSVELWFKRAHLKHVRKYRVFVTLRTSASDACSAEPCTDRVPDRGTIRHRLRELCSHQEPTIVGTRRDDTLRATARSDVIAGRGGDDRIVGASGSDSVCAGPGDDVIDAGRGFLLLRGGPGADRISASGPRPRPCDDTGGGSASCAYPEAIALGGGGADELSGGRYYERLIGGDGNDVLGGRLGRDSLDGGPGRDLGRGGGGDDTCRRVERRHSC